MSSMINNAMLTCNFTSTSEILIFYIPQTTLTVLLRPLLISPVVLRHWQLMSACVGACCCLAACRHNNRTLIEYGAAVNVQAAPFCPPQNTSLYEATGSEDDAVVQILLDRGADANGKNAVGETALHGAAKFGNEKAAQMLLRRSIDIDTETFNKWERKSFLTYPLSEFNRGWTALHQAAHSGHANIVRLLLDYGAYMYSRTALGKTPLDLAFVERRQDVFYFLDEVLTDVVDLMQTSTWYLELMEQINDHNTKSDCAFLMRAHWLYNCLTTHSMCDTFKSGIPSLPSRVLDVGSRDGSQEPFLYESGGQHAAYFTLSYRRETSNAVTTTSENFSDFQKAIPLAKLSQTIQDAIFITRKFNIRFLWIDALCIIQDSLGDWKKEAEMNDLEDFPVHGDTANAHAGKGHPLMKLAQFSNEPGYRDSDVRKFKDMMRGFSFKSEAYWRGKVYWMWRKFVKDYS
ncbi:hypothetical protein G7Y89_g7939 [Cudoniella acicularis]|uniref:Heterokaryon incompatibility domain-containing protein n=1 Tax=Cudoniella acicularis TaxID=354080 RepID=A0A8H4RHJ9_9HELO|nr:hypothetical protein G7Y89_g7939 [Cudoniella acicularis]